MATRIDAIDFPEQWVTVQKNHHILTQNLTDLIQNKELNALIKNAQFNSPSLMEAALVLKESKMISRRNSGSRLPQVDSTLNKTYVKEGKNDSTQTYGMSLGVSWEIDVWGRLADATAARHFDEEASKADLDAARNSLAGSIIKEWLNYVSLKEMAIIEERRLASLNGTLEVIRERYRTGLGNLQDLEAARTDAASTSASLESRLLAIETSNRAIQKLMGNIDPIHLESPADIPQVNIPMAEIPGTVIGRRPDIQAAYSRIRAEDLRAKVAFKELLPKFNLNPTMSLQGRHPSTMLRADPVWNILGQMTAPLFQGGRLKADVKIAELNAEKAYWRYREVLVNAIIEVEEKLAAERSLLKQQNQLTEALKHAVNNRKNYEERYHQGLVDILNLLTAHQTAFGLEIQIMEVKRSLLINRIDLGLALGMGV